MLTYVGKGYSPGFTARFDEIAARLSLGEEILVVAGPDDICAPLLSKADAHCVRPGAGARDARAAVAVAGLLGRPVAAGECLALDAAELARMREAFRVGAIRAACQDCAWSGLCGRVADSGFAGVRLHMGEAGQARFAGDQAWTKTIAKMP